MNEWKNDSEGKIFFIDKLEKSGFNNVTTTDQYSYYDIEGEWNGIKYYFELKNRPCESTLYNDSIIEKTKYDNLYQLNKEHNSVFIVNFFTDCYHIHHLLSPHTTQNHYCQKTNNWNRTKVPKTLISYMNTNKTRREYDS